MAETNSAAATTAYSFEAEQAVLGCILTHPETFTTVAIYVRAEYFFYPQHKAIYSIMQMLDAANGKIDILMILEHLRADKVFGSPEDGKKYLYQLAESVPSAANLENYCKILRDKFYLRSLIDVSNEIITMAESSAADADTVLDNAEQRILDIRQGRAIVGPSKLSDVISVVYETLNKLNSSDAEQYRGLKTGFPDFDRMCTGLNRSDLVLIGARPAMGKTSFALNMAKNVAENLYIAGSDQKVLFFSLEMSKEQLAQRVIATEARISSQKMRTGDLTPKEFGILSSACMRLIDFNLYFDDTSSITVPEMKARVRRLGGVAAVFIDYLQLMQSAKRTENRVQEVSEITRSLKLMAKELMIPVVVCAQLSRGTENRGGSHKPQLADLRESGSIEQDADIVVMLYREDYYKNDKKQQEQKDDGADQIEVNAAELLVQKNRHGPTGSIKLAWNPKFTLYTCFDREHQAEEKSPEEVNGEKNAEADGQQGEG